MHSRARRAIAAVAATVLTGAIVTSGALADPSTTPPSTSSAEAAAHLATPVLSARRVPDLVRSNIADNQVRAAIQPLVDKMPENSCIAVSQGGRTIVAEHADAGLTPASTEKLLTATAALRELGPDTRLQTIAAASAPLSGSGVIDGDLFLIGGGDPLLTTNGYRLSLENPNQAINDFNQLADRLSQAGVKEIRGDIVGDDSRYDTERWVKTWPARYQRQDTVGPLSALMVNDGNTGLTTDPDTVAKTRQPGDPPALAAETLETLLTRRGIKVDGSGRAGSAPNERVEIAHLDSMTIRDIVGEMLLESDNTTAELLTKELGLHRSGQGTTAAGVQATEDVMTGLGLPGSEISLVDGSGLDPQNRLTCAALVGVLNAAGPHPFDGQLPVAGDTGTLRLRMRHTAAEGKVRAKTGTLTGVDALAGVVPTASGDELTFAYVVNAPDAMGSAPLDEFAAALVGASTGPALDTLGPRPTS